MLKILENIPLFHNFTFHYNKELDKLNSKITTQNIILQQVLFTKNHLGICKVLEKNDYELNLSQRATLSYLQHISRLDDLNFYSIINENGQYYAQLKKNIYDAINLALESIENEKNEVEVFKYIHNIFKRQLPLKLFSEKLIIPKKILNFESYLENDYDVMDQSISLLDLSVNREEVKLENLLDTELSTIPPYLDEILIPTFENLGLYNVENYVAHIEEKFDNFEDEEEYTLVVNGFSIPVEKRRMLVNIVNEIIAEEKKEKKMIFIHSFND